MVLPLEPVKQRRISPWVLATCVLATALIVAVVVALNRGRTGPDVVHLAAVRARQSAPDDELGVR